VWIAGLVVCGFVIFLLRHDPVSTVFLGFRQDSDDRQALVIMRNTSSSALQCYGHLASSRLDQQLELRQPFGLTLNRKASAQVSVTIPPGDGPLRISCEVMLVDRHCAIVRWLGELLRSAGIYLYHGISPRSPCIQAVAVAGFPPSQQSYARSSVSNLKVQIQGPKPLESLSDYLVFEAFTNSWTLP
jgi:hypothetical protein